jgi:ribose transport system substrate-binding protein
MKILTKVIVLSAIMLTLGWSGLIAGGNQSAKSDDGKEGKQLTIGFCNLSETYDFFLTVKQSMEQACAQNGVKMLYAVSEQDPQRMRQNWDLFVNQGADLIVDFSILSDAGSTLATQYRRSNKIPVISVDNVYENAYFFGVNNSEAGKVAGRFMADKVKEKWNGQIDAMLQFYLESNGPEVKKRNTGIYDGMIESGIVFPENKVTWINASGASASVGGDPGVMRNLVMDYLTAHPNDRHIVIGCYNDDGGNAAFAAVKAANRTNDVMLVSHNADPPSIDNLKLPGENSWVGTVNYSPTTYGDQIIALALRILSGENVPNENYANVFVVHDGNVTEYFK